MEAGELSAIKENLIGMTLDGAKVKAAEHGWSVRVMRIGDKHCIGTCDFRANRINVSVDESKQNVIDVIGIG